MSDQGGHPEPGWYADPNGRHEYRYWDGATWSDQVSDGGVVSTDPATAQDPTVTTPTAEEGAAAPVAPVAMGGADTPYVPPAADTGEGRKLPVGVLALAGLAVAAVVVAIVLIAFGGDDGGDSDNASTADDVASDALSDASDALSDASGDFSGDFSDEFSDSFSDLSDYSDLFSDFSDLSDYSDLFSDFSDFDDFSDFSDLVPGGIPGTPEAGDPVDPSDFIDEYGTVPRFDALADSCFGGDFDDCNQLYTVTPISPSTNSYEGYGATCGGRLAEESPGTCATLD